MKLLTPEAIAAIKTAVAKGEWREDIRAGAWVGKIIAQVLRLDLEDNLDLVKEVIKTLIANRVLKQEQRDDAHRNKVMFIVVEGQNISS
jgi:hypothetical protein